MGSILSEEDEIGNQVLTLPQSCFTEGFRGVFAFQMIAGDVIAISVNLYRDSIAISSWSQNAIYNTAVVVLTLAHRYNAVRGHRTGSNKSGASGRLPLEENKWTDTDYDWLWARSRRQFE